MDALLILAKYTYLIIGIGFIPLLFFFTQKFIHFTAKDSIKQVAEANAIKLENKDEVLHPLSCKSCGGILATTEEEGKCQHCGTVTPLPSGHKSLIRSRKNYEAVMNKALDLQKRYEFLTNPLIDKGLLIGAAWIFASLLILAFASEPLRQICFNFIKDPALLDILPTLFTLFSLTVCLALLLFRVNFKGVIRTKIPLRKFDELVIASEQTLNCYSCAAPVFFEKHRTGHICQYCGVEMYRAEFTVKAKEKSKDIDSAAKNSLINMMSAVDKTVADFMIIIGLFCIVWCLALLGAFIYNFFGILDFLSSRGQLLSKILLLSIIIAFGWMFTKLIRKYATK